MTMLQFAPYVLMFALGFGSATIALALILTWKKKRRHMYDRHLMIHETDSDEAKAAKHDYQIRENIVAVFRCIGLFGVAIAGFTFYASLLIAPQSVVWGQRLLATTALIGFGITITGIYLRVKSCYQTLRKLGPALRKWYNNALTNEQLGDIRETDMLEGLIEDENGLNSALLGLPTMPSLSGRGAPSPKRLSETDKSDKPDKSDK